MWFNAFVVAPLQPSLVDRRFAPRPIPPNSRLFAIGVISLLQRGDGFITTFSSKDTQSSIFKISGGNEKGPAAAAAAGGEKGGAAEPGTAAAAAATTKTRRNDQWRAVRSTMAQEST